MSVALLCPASSAVWWSAPSCSAPPRSAPSSTEPAPGGSAAPSCPSSRVAKGHLPGVRDQHRTLGYWLQRVATHADPDVPLLAAEEIAAHNVVLGSAATDPADGGSDDPAPPLTRRKLLEAAFQRIGAPCDHRRNARDEGCARVVPELLEPFGLDGLADLLSRVGQAEAAADAAAAAAPMRIRMDRAPTQTERLALLDAAARRAVVLLHLPGQVLLYLGRNAAGIPMVLGGIGEYAEPCGPNRPGADGATPHTVVQVGLSLIHI